MFISPKKVLLIVVLFVSACSPANTPLPPEPQTVPFQTASGVAITGRYFPAGVDPAPAVVLIHGGGGRMENWVELGMVDWLQNRGMVDEGAPTDEPAIFAPLPAERSFGVFIFTVAGDWTEAGRAAVDAVKTLPGVDPARIALIGGSVGADAATEACTVAGCVGALALSPTGVSQGRRYGEIVAQLDAEGKAAWCLNAERDGGGCPAAQGSRYRAIVVPGAAHGLGLLRAGHLTGNWQVVRDFLLCVFEGEC